MHRISQGNSSLLKCHLIKFSKKFPKSSSEIMVSSFSRICSEGNTRNFIRAVQNVQQTRKFICYLLENFQNEV